MAWESISWPPTLSNSAWVSWVPTVLCLNSFAISLPYLLE